MKIINFEFKAKTPEPNKLEEKLKTLNPVFVGTDHQTDTYFHMAAGRLKLREGNIENSLIYYERPNTGGSKQSDVHLYEHAPSADLKNLLIKIHGIKTIVEKKRKIYFIDNVKFHFDQVDGLGSFVEVEAIDRDGTHSLESLKKQCDFYAGFLGISNEHFIAASYSDLIGDRDIKE